MYKELTRKIFDGIINQNDIADIQNNIEEYWDKEITELGIDSLTYMQLVLRIEEITKKEIDLDNFDIESISTLGKILLLSSQS